MTPPTPRRAVLALALVAVAATLWGWSERRARVAAARPAGAERRGLDVDRLAANERDLLRGEVRRLGLELAQTRAAQTAQTPAASPPTKPAAGPERPTPEQEMDWLMARGHFLDEALQQQPRDERWAAPIEAKARALAEKRGDAGLKLDRVDCRSSACRMEWSYPDAAARTHHIESLAEDFGELPRVSYAYPGEPETHTRAIMYMAVQDHPLPSMDYQTYLAIRGR